MANRLLVVASALAVITATMAVRAPVARANQVKYCDPDGCVTGPNLKVPEPNLSTPPTGPTVNTQQTTALQSWVPSTGSVQAKVAVIGSGVQANLFPSAVQGEIWTSPETDSVGVGTLMTSVLLQLLPNVEVDSFVIGPGPGGLGLNTEAIANALRQVPGVYDAVVLAFPPLKVLDPHSTLGHYVNYGLPEGSGLNTLEEAILSHPAKVIGLEAGVPLDPICLAASASSVSVEIAGASPRAA